MMRWINRCLKGALALLCLNFAQAQEFQKRDSLGIRGLVEPEVFWVDFNSDRFYDVVIYGADTIDGGTAIYLIQNNGDSTFSLNHSALLNYDIHLLKPIDYLRDSRVDLSFSGVKDGTDSLTSVFFINEDLTLTESNETLLDSLVSDFYVLDLDNDSDLDLLYVKDSLVNLLEGGSSGFALESRRLMDHKASQLFSFDLNSDGLMDWMITSPEDEDTLNRFFLNDGELVWENTLVEPFSDSLIIESISIGKWDKTPYPELLVEARNELGDVELLLIDNTSDSLKIRNRVFTDSLISESFLSDFNSNGTTDIFLRTDLKSYFLEDASEPSDTLRTAQLNVIKSHFGDWNLDGHIDLVQLQSRGVDSLQLVFYLNELTEVNFGPSVPEILTAVQDGNEQILAWSRSNDDLTEAELISYDLTLNYEQGQQVLSLPNASDSSKSLIQPFHGSVLYTSNIVYNNLFTGDYNYRTLGVDNAFNLLGQGTGSSACEFAVCELSAMIETNQSMCLGESLTFGTEGVTRHWYSTIYGPIETTDIIEYVAVADDTLYGSVTRFNDCSEGQLKIEIEVIVGEQINLEDSYSVCSGDALLLSIPITFSNVTWASGGEELSNTNSVTLEPTSDMTIEVNATNSLDCPVSFTTFVDFTLFEPGVKDSVLTVEFGEQVQLEAFGGSNYAWTPTNGLSSAQVANPFARPITSSIYTVAISNNQGCTQLFEVFVDVIQKGSVANLFSPNGDGNNDQLKVFLTGVPSKFEFQIYNRSGLLVYSTNNSDEATNRGWDGRQSGSELPTGVYYWRVSGSYENGQRVLLNGKEKGSFTLIR